MLRGPRGLLEPRNRSSISNRDKCLFLPPKWQTGCVAHLGSYSADVGPIFPVVKRPWREADLSLPYSAAIKNAWGCASIPAYGFLIYTGTAVLYLFNDMDVTYDIHRSFSDKLPCFTRHIRFIWKSTALLYTKLHNDTENTLFVPPRRHVTYLLNLFMSLAVMP